MELKETIRGRRSIRKYKEKKVPDFIIEELLELAIYAPSSMDGQPWHFIVVRSNKTKKQLAEIKATVPKGKARLENGSYVYRLTRNNFVYRMTKEIACEYSSHGFTEHPKDPFQKKLLSEASE